MAYPMYNPYYPQQNYIPQQVTQQATNQSQQIQSGGFIPVPSEDVARNYPVAPGNSVTFKNENAPYVYTKTMGFSQLDRPIFEKYKLVREEDAPTSTQTAQNDPIDTKTMNDAIDGLNDEIRAIWKELDILKSNPNKKSTVGKRKEVIDGDSE